MTDPVRAGVYCRMSIAALNDPTKVEDQARISGELGERLGWEIAAGCGYPDRDGVYTDNSRSAWQKNRKRPAWDRMLADVEAGKLGAVIVYHGDRLVRQPYDLETLIGLADGKGIRLASPTGMRDLDNTDDRFVLRILVAQACMESDNTSRRRKAQYERWRREGRTRPGGRGGRAYGFATDGINLIPAEVPVIQEAAARVLAGEGTGAIARDLSARGHATTTGGPWSHHALRKMLARPRYAGLMPDGIRQAAWQPILDRETWEAVCAVLDAKAAGFGYATNARRYLLSGIARCGACGSGLQIRMESRRTHLTGYGCVKPGCRKVQRSRELLDEYVITRVIAKLGDERNPAPRVPRNTALAAEFRALARQRAQTEAAITDPSKGAHLPLLLRRLESVDARLGQLRSLAAGNAQSRLRGAHAGITREEFDALPLSVRRALVAACFTVTVLPASRRGPGFNTADVRLGTP
jgi:site-specific DNA recombinase